MNRSHVISSGHMISCKHVILHMYMISHKHMVEVPTYSKMIGEALVYLHGQVWPFAALYARPRHMVRIPGGYRQEGRCHGCMRSFLHHHVDYTHSYARII
jgi:hypothetical protein